MNKLSLVGFIATVFVATACSSPDPGSPESRYERIQEKREAQAEQVEKQIGSLPDWYLELPRSDHAIYSAGTGVSTDLDMAVTKATLNGKRKLADRIRGELTEKVREYATEIGLDEDAQVMQDMDRVTANIIRKVPVYGYNQKDLKVQVEGHRYRVYILLEYPDAEINDVMQNRFKEMMLRRKAESKNEMFKELEKELDKEVETETKKL
jgi:hypothetical protein